MSWYRVTAFVKVDGDLFSPLAAGDTIAQVDEPWDGVKAADPTGAAEVLFAIGNRMRDLEGRDWPSDVRSMSVGDLVKVESMPGVSPRTVTFLACDRFGWTELPEPVQRIVPLGGQDMATSRPAVAAS